MPSSGPLRATDPSRFPCDYYTPEGCRHYGTSHTAILFKTRAACPVKALILYPSVSSESAVLLPQKCLSMRSMKGGELGIPARPTPMTKTEQKHHTQTCAMRNRQ